MLVAGFDTETTGLNVEKDSIIEVGAVLWDTERKKPLVIANELITLAPGVVIDPQAQDTHGITPQDLDLYGIEAKSAFSLVNHVFNLAEFVVAHNGNLFDKPMFENNCKRESMAWTEKPWIDTSCDVDYPADVTTRKLKLLAAEHGFLNPFPHRAVFDVLTMLRVCDYYDWDKIVTYSKAPTVTVKAETSFAQKELAKKQSFRWDAERKQWIKSVKDFQVDDVRKAAKAAGFDITVLKGAK